MPGKEIISTDEAPKVIGPYSAGVQAGNFVFTAGQLGIDPKTGEFALGGVAAQTRQALLNLTAVLETAGVSLGHVVKTTVFLNDLDDYGSVNEVYGQFFNQDPPARSAVQVARLPKDALVEIEAVAFIGG